MIDQTLELIETLAPDTRERCYAFVRDARLAGIPLVVISARRSLQANVDVGGAAKSYHLDGRAFDVGVVGYTRDQLPLWWWTALGRYAEGKYFLWWGGSVTWMGRPDVNHFDDRYWSAGAFPVPEI